MDWSAPKLLMECEAADRLRDKIIESLPQRLGRYYGTAFGYDDGEYWPENYYFTWASYILPQIIFQNPRVKIGSLRLSEISEDAKALEIAINRWIRDTDQRTTLRQLGFDMGFAYGVSFTSPVPTKEGVDVPWRPQTLRVDQRLYSMDALANGQHDARFQQHVTIEDRDIMLGWVKDRPEEGWNRKAIEDAGEVEKYDLVKSESKDVPNRGQVGYRNIWCPEVNDYLKPDDDPENYNGTIYTLALFPSSEKGLEWLRPPRPAFGPRWGRYTLFGAHPVPNCPYSLGSLVAVDAQLQELNALALGNYKGARRRKKIGIFDENQHELAAKWAAVEDGETLGIPGFDKSHFAEAEFGGITDTGLAQEEQARRMADRNTGIADVQRGGTGQAGTTLATEITQAVAASNVRTADLVEQFSAAVRRQYTTVAWDMWKMDKVSVPLTTEDADMLRQQMLQKGMPPEQVMMAMPPGATIRWSGENNGAPFDSLELEIEPYSMKRTDEPLMQQRAMQALEIASSLAPLTIQFPNIRWKDILAKLGDAMNWPGFADILDENVTAQLTMLQLQGQAQAQAGPPTDRPQPRLAGDIKSPAQGFPKPGGGGRPQLPQRAGAGGAGAPKAPGAKPAAAGARA